MNNQENKHVEGHIHGHEHGKNNILFNDIGEKTYDCRRKSGGYSGLFLDFLPK